ncbi:Thioredoxin domain-containing protein 5 [Quaeritorhiza haematococci]|nr:Thioredoxin domain-containing protein 5 [Quaeritorhiza haematococci]
MSFSRLVLLLTLLVALLSATTTTVDARLLRRKSAEAKAQLKELAEAADKEIDFISQEDLDSTIQNGGVWLVFFGAKWCPFTQRFTPKWLEVQELVKANGLSKLNLRKLECSINESFCREHQAGDYPTVNLYVDGKLVEEYPDVDEVENLYKYIEKQAKTL